MDRPAGVIRPGLKAAIQVARLLTHVFLVVGFLGIFMGMAMGGRDGFWFILGSVAGFLLSYFAWVGLVLFGYMNFSLSAMLWFVMALGACIGLLMSREEPLMLIGGIGLLVLVFAAVVPISRYDPTTEPTKPGTSGNGLLLSFLPILSVVLMLTGNPGLVLLGMLGLVGFVVVAAHMNKPVSSESQTPKP